MSVKPKKEDWMKEKWRPMMAIMYMVTCVADFVIFPVLWSVLQALQGGQVTSQWNPLTLQGAGLFHLAMGAVLGVAAWSRGQEKIAGAATTQPTGMQGFSNSSYQQTSFQPSYKSQYNDLGSNQNPVINYRGKAAPIQPEQPEI
jgi:hypothetical protein